MGCDKRAQKLVSILLISIHAARVGCDKLSKNMVFEMAIFQSTQPEWAATKRCTGIEPVFVISIHAARVGCDIAPENILIKVRKFQSTQPEWAATLTL